MVHEKWIWYGFFNIAHCINHQPIKFLEQSYMDCIGVFGWCGCNIEKPNDILYQLDILLFVDSIYMENSTIWETLNMINIAVKGFIIATPPARSFIDWKSTTESVLLVNECLSFLPPEIVPFANSIVVSSKIKNLRVRVCVASCQLTCQNAIDVTCWGIC